jgi:hypothetical protein
MSEVLGGSFSKLPNTFESMRGLGRIFEVAASDIQTVPNLVKICDCKLLCKTLYTAQVPQWS